LIFAMLAIRREPLGIERADVKRVLLAGIGGMGLSQLCYVGSLAHTSVSHSVILIASSPLLAAGYHLLIKRERLDSRSLLGVGGGFAGVVLLVTAAEGANGASLFGDLLALAAATTWIGATVWPVSLFAKYGILRATAWMLAASTLLIVPVSLWSIADTLRHPPSVAAWGSLVYSAVFGIMIGNMLWQRAVQQAGTRRTLVYLYLEPVGALILAALFLGERLTPLQAVGGLLALTGVALVKRA
jgi:drug/metabolite transporter (DMT)-like permease